MATPRKPWPNVVLLTGAALLAAGIAVCLTRMPAPGSATVHRNVLTTVFWVGEGAGEANRYIHNRSSAWTEDWVGAFGGVDDPEKRCGHLPCGFVPKENPFYFALPYNDLDESCGAKPSRREVPWSGQPTAEGDSIVKNRWIKISHNGRTAFAQWQDSGPYGEDDTSYVFGGAKPKAGPGLDVSPAAASYLRLDGQGRTDWQFVSWEDVPAGPWRQTVTTSPPDCASQLVSIFTEKTRPRPQNSVNMAQLAEHLDFEAWNARTHSALSIDPSVADFSPPRENIARMLAGKAVKVARAVGHTLVRLAEPRPAPGYEEHYDPVTFTREWRPRRDLFGRVIR